MRKWLVLRAQLFLAWTFMWAVLIGSVVGLIYLSRYLQQWALQ